MCLLVHTGSFNTFSVESMQVWQVCFCFMSMSSVRAKCPLNLSKKCPIIGTVRQNVKCVELLMLKCWFRRFSSTLTVLARPKSDRYLGGEDLEVALLRDDGVQEVEVEAVVLPWRQSYRGRELKRPQTPDIRHYPSLAAIKFSSKQPEKCTNMYESYSL